MTSLLKDRVCLLIEDNPKTASLLREALVFSFPEINIISFSLLREAKAWLQSQNQSGVQVGLALVDLGLPDGSGVEFIRLLNQVQPEAQSLVVTIYGEDSYLFEALSAGAFGYILKDEGMEMIADSLRKLANDEPPISPSIARRMLQHFREEQISREEEVELTPRQRETLVHIVRGLTVGETADRLGLSPQTVAGYIKIIYQKLHVKNRAEATREAIRRGLG